MDPTNFYHLGQIQHQETLREAEEQHLAKPFRREPTRWQRLIARLMPSPAKQPVPCPDVLASAQ